MRQPTRLSLALASLLVISSTAHAGLTTTLTGASDYLFDGVSQTNGGPALQASVDYAFDFGLYAGTWVSNVDFAGIDQDMEQDYYAGYYWTINDNFAMDFGAARYTYHGLPDPIDYTEGYIGVVFGNTKLKAYYSDDDDAWAGAAWRVKGNHSFQLTDILKLNLEATYTRFSDLADAGGYSDDDQIHGKIGVAADIDGFILEAGVQATDESDLFKDAYGEDNVDETLYLTVTKTFELL
ncbi:MAG: hypothetical protein HYV16_04195 [Gammaproteobacteria bacterium]|nr:hypothetical protein [Gammaproteobacteria bacterium]